MGAMVPVEKTRRLGGRLRQAPARQWLIEPNHQPRIANMPHYESGQRDSDSQQTKGDGPLPGLLGIVALTVVHVVWLWIRACISDHFSTMLSSLIAAEERYLKPLQEIDIDCARGA